MAATKQILTILYFLILYYDIGFIPVLALLKNNTIVKINNASITNKHPKLKYQLRFNTNIGEPLPE
jgi:hypothetical protein